MTSSSVEHILQEYAPMVRRLALRMVSRLPSSVEVDDLIQAGMIGLMDAARRYEKQVGIKFTSYAITRINGAMVDELRNQDWLPRSARTAAKKIEDAVKKTSRALGRQPDEKELAEHLGMSDDQYSRLLDSAVGVQIVHYEDFVTSDRVDAMGAQHIGPTGSFTVEAIESEYGNPEHNITAQHFKRSLVQAIEKLPEKEKLVLSLYYEQDLNYKEISEVIGLTQGRVCQLRAQAITRVRAIMQEEGWDALPSELEAHI